MANPRHPVYIISKGRWESRLTSKALESMGVPYHIVIEPQELEQYSAVIAREKILVLPFSNLGQGSIPARNWVWEHSIERGASHHWILDDNISFFARYHLNKKLKITNGICFVVVEDIVNRYQNVAISGLQYEMFLTASRWFPTALINTRVYSCILIRNDISYRWRGRYNEDTDLSIRVLKDGWCTILLQSFCAKKIATLTMKGGNTESLYLLKDNKDGRLLMAQSLLNQHPDIVKITRKWGRWQHQVNYKPFKRNKLLLKPEFVGTVWEPNEYGLKIIKVAKPTPNV